MPKLSLMRLIAAVLLAAPVTLALAQSRIDLQQLYLSAEKAFREQEVDRAKTLFQQVLGESSRERGLLRQSQGQFAAAAADLEQAEILAPSDPHLKLDLATAYLAGEQTELAQTLLQQLSTNRSQDPEVLALLAQSETTAGRLPSARATMERAVQLQPSNPFLTYSLGTVLLAQKDLPGASRVFRQLQHLLGDSAQLHVLLGRTYFDEGFFSSAQVELNRALRFDLSVRHAHFFLGASFLLQPGATGREVAQREFELEARAHPDEFPSQFVMSALLASKKQWIKAAVYLNRAEQLEGNELEIGLHRAHIELLSGNPRQAADDLANSIGLSGKSPALDLAIAHFLLGKCYKLLEDEDRSTVEAAQAFHLFPASAHWEEKDIAEQLSAVTWLHKLRHEPSATAWTELDLSKGSRGDGRLMQTLTKVLANAHNRMGLIAAQRQEFEEAFRQFVMVAEVQPDFPRIDFNVGLAAFHVERMPEAVRALERAVRNSPSDMAARELLGRAQFEHGDFAAALSNLQAALGDNTDDPGLLLAIGTCFARTDRMSEAQAVFKRLLQTQSGQPEIHLLVGQSAYAQGKTDVAQAELQNALQIDPEIPQAHFYLGIIALDVGDFASAEKEFRAEVATHPTDPKAQYHLAYVLLEEERAEEAIHLLQEVTRAVPGYAQAHYLLGKALTEQGQLDYAVAELEEATREDPDESYIHYVLGRAYLRLGRTAEAKRELELTDEIARKRLSRARRSNAQADRP
ncbi:MAG: tetratricopeptide repeat protein [Candidatus Sulfotelmatobacter sp.]|jgi:tetratricopeptide (TPR) repeat protein